ncbi:MAG: DUF1684 domain-containing protein [Paracoccaceae bacterium]
MTIPAEYTQWKAARLQSLTAEDGWLNLTDRVDIPPGPQTVGNATDNAIILSRGPAHLGTLLPGFRFQTPDGIPQSFQAGRGNPELRVDQFLLEIHTVDGHPALRVRDLTLPRAVTLRYFPYDPAWKIRARWEALTAPQSQSIDQKGGNATTVSLTHRAHFSLEGHTITLLATHWKSGLPMFVIRDQTAGRETYPASRFLMGEDVTADAITLDFNKAHNPPCAFTDFAICPLPPRENILPFAMRAGELALR